MYTVTVSFVATFAYWDTGDTGTDRADNGATSARVFILNREVKVAREDREEVLLLLITAHGRAAVFLTAAASTL